MQWVIEKIMSKIATVSIIGKPNAGKSTLLNLLIGQKISIVTPKVQTTRSSIKGIYTDGEHQIVFIDTPGIFTPKKKLEKAMVRSAWSSIVGTDIICIIIDTTDKKYFNEEFKKLLKHISKIQAKKILIFNKIDKLSQFSTKTENHTIANLPNSVLPTSSVGKYLPNFLSTNLSKEIEEIIELFPDSSSVFISALKGKNTNNLLDHLKTISNDGQWLYPEDEITNAPLRFLCNEITREKLFFNLDEEIPYNLTVETEKWEQLSDSEVKIYQTIIVNKDSYKMIVLGKDGSKIKKIGTQSRKEISECFGFKTHLFLFVKVREDWDLRSFYYENMGLELPKD